MKLEKKQIKYLCIISFATNITSIILGSLHYLIGLNIVIGILFSIVIVLSWFLNNILIVVNEFKIVKTTIIGKKMNRLGYGFLGMQIIAIFLLVGGLFLLNANWFNPFLQYSLILIGFFSFFAYGTTFSYLNLRVLDNREVWKVE